MSYTVEIEDTYNHITFKTMQKAIAHIPDLKIRKWIDEDIQFLLWIMYWSGLRPSEAIFLKKEDFNLITRDIFLGKTKTKKGGDKAIIPVVFVNELDEWLKDKEPGRLFPELTYKPLYMWLKKLGRLLDISAWTTPKSESGEMTVCHAPRKSIGKNLIAGVHLKPNGKPYTIIDASKLLRHKSVAMTQDNYLKVTYEGLKTEY